MNERMYEWTNDWTNKRMNEWLNDWSNERMIERINEWTNDWMSNFVSSFFVFLYDVYTAECAIDSLLAYLLSSKQYKIYI